MKAILVGVKYSHMTYDFEKSLEELKSLAYSCDMEVLDIVTQKLDVISPQYYIGKGKVDEIKNRIDSHDIVIFNEELSPLQVKNLTDELGVEVSDRSDLILRIFESRAQTKEAKLQVEIARNQYLLPRLAGMKKELYSQQGGSGFRGRGEKQIELDRRIIQKHLVQAKRELQHIVKQRQTQRRKRQRLDQKVVCLVGYTNSGKSSLLNYFTQKKVFQQDMLFASLQTASRHVMLKGHKSVIMSDTVGFINQLPHHLIQAFRSTLEEVKEADVLVHVIDASSPDCLQHIQTTLEVLQELGVKDTPMIYVYNKIDQERYAFLQPCQPYVYTSVKDQIGLDALEDLLIETLFKDDQFIELFIPYDQSEVLGILKQNYEFIKEDYKDEGIFIQLYIEQKDLHKYQKYIYEPIS